MTPAQEPGPEALLGHGDWLRALARRLVRDEGDADDAVQETYLRALERDGEAPRSPRAWLAGVLRNVVAGARRGKARTGPREAARALEEARSAGNADVLESLVALERQRALLDRVLALPEDQRRALVLRYYEGLAPRAIAAREATSVHTIKSRLKRALAGLREELAREHGDRRAWALWLLPLSQRAPRAALGLPASGLLAVLAGTAAVALVLASLALRSRPADPALVPRGLAPPASGSERASLLRPQAGDRVPMGVAAALERREAGEGRLSAAYFPGAVPLDEAGHPTHAVALIVDPFGQRPSGAARVHVVREATFPLPGVFAPLRSAEADADGYVRVRIDDLPGSLWLYFDAEGHAMQAELTRTPDPVIALERGLDVEVELRDAWDRPLAGAHLGRLIGCGHTPDVAWARTDARGRAILRSIHTEGYELWPVAEGSLGDYLEMRDWRQGDPPLVLRTTPGTVVEGVVVDRSGAPVPRVFVGEQQSHRGPWCQADDSGRFRFVGASFFPHLSVWREDEPGSALGSFQVDPRSGPVRLVVPSVEEDSADLSALAALEPQPELLVRGLELLSEHAEVELLSEEGAWYVTDLLRDGGREPRLSVPAQGPLALSVIVEDRVRVSEVQRGTAPLSVELMPPSTTLVRARVLGPDGPARAVAQLSEYRHRSGGSELEPTSEIELRTGILGRAWLFVTPADPSLHRLRVPLVVHEDMELLDLGELRLQPREPARLTVLLADGAPAAGAELNLWRDGYTWTARLDGQGAFVEGELPLEGDWIEVQGPRGWVPLTARLTGPGPWSLAWPAGEIEVEARGEGGEPLEDWVLLLDGRPFEGGARRVLRGVAPGNRRLVVAAPDRLARVFDLECDEAESLLVRAVLSLR